MQSIIHLSDLQIPRIAEGRLERLATFLNDLAPDLIVLTGDLTERAHSEAFRQAALFLQSLKAEVLSVPGNHDIPLYRLHKRFFNRFEAYKGYISNELNPHYTKDGVALAGINTARSLVFKGGRINHRQLKNACSFLKNNNFCLRIVATHHPFALPPYFKYRQVATGARDALRELAACAVDLFLAGHYHISSAISKRIGTGTAAYDSVFVQAGTLSERRRGEPLSFNLISPQAVTLKIANYHLTDDNDIYLAGEHFFQKEKEGWKRKIA